MDQGPVRLRPFPSPTPSGPRTSTTARGIFQIHNSTSDPKTRRDKQLEGGRRKFGISLSVFSEDWASSEDACRARDASCSVLGGKKKSFICIVCIYCLHNDATFKGYRNMYEFQV